MNAVLLYFFFKLFFSLTSSDDSDVPNSDDSSLLKTTRNKMYSEEIGVCSENFESEFNTNITSLIPTHFSTQLTYTEPAETHAFYFFSASTTFTGKY